MAICRREENPDLLNNSPPSNRRRPLLLYLLYTGTQSLYLMIVLNELGVANQSIPPYVIAYFVLLGSSFTGALLWGLLGALTYLFLFYRSVYKGPLSPILSVVSFYFLFSSISLVTDLVLLPIIGASSIELYSSIKALIDTSFSTLSFIYFYRVFNHRYGMKRVDDVAMILMLLLTDIVLRIYYPKIAAQQLLKNHALYP